MKRTIFAVIVLLAGCAAPAPDNDPYVVFARQYFDLLARKDYAALEAKLDPEITSDPEFKSEDLRSLFQLVGFAIRSEPPQSSKVVDYRPSSSDTRVVIEYLYPDGKTRLELTMIGSGQNILVRHFKVNSDFDIDSEST